MEKKVKYIQKRSIKFKLGTTEIQNRNYEGKAKGKEAEIS